MNLEQAIRAVERGWHAQPMCLYLFNAKFYAVAALNSARETELRDANFTTLIGTYKADDQSAYLKIMRDV